MGGLVHGSSLEHLIRRNGEFPIRSLFDCPTMGEVLTSKRHVVWCGMASEAARGPPPKGGSRGRSGHRGGSGWMNERGQTVCLNMIVKNEAHVIRRCLAS